MCNLISFHFFFKYSLIQFSQFSQFFLFSVFEIMKRKLFSKDMNKDSFRKRQKILNEHSEEVLKNRWFERPNTSGKWKEIEKKKKKIEWMKAAKNERKFQIRNSRTKKVNRVRRNKLKEEYYKGKKAKIYVNQSEKKALKHSRKK